MSLSQNHILPAFMHVFRSIPVIITVLIRAEISSSRTGFVSSFSRSPRSAVPEISALILPGPWKYTNSGTEIAHYLSLSYRKQAKQ